ncbi:MAG: hypothetical protein ACLGI8_13390 [Acidimicrobiia bacterium]
MPPPVRSRWWQAHWPAAVLAVAAAAVALAAKAVIFPHLSWNRDEPVYLWQMEVLRAGRLAAPDGGHPGLFLPWLSAARGGELFGQYTLGWPLALLFARVATGTATAALPLAAVLGAVGTYALGYELLGRRRTATVAGALMVASPIFALQTGVHLAYVFTLGLGLLFAALLLSGLRRRRPARLVAAGALLGWVFLTRPLDAVIWGAAVGGFALWHHRDRGRAVLGGGVIAGLAAFPFLAVTLAVNHRLTGDPLTFAMTVKDPMDTFGFGERRLMPGFAPHDYTLRSALRSTAKNAFFFPWFLAGTYVAVVVAAWAVWRGRREASTWLLLGLGLAFPVAYLPFWGTFLSSLASRISGPIYLVPLYAPVCILTASALVRWWDERPRLAWVVAVLLVVATVPAAWDRFALNRTISQSQAPWQESLEDIDEPALVLVADSGEVLYANPFGANRPDLDGPRLFASFDGPEVLELIAEEPGRAVYLQAATVASQDLGPREDPAEPAVVVRPVEVVAGRAVTLHLAVDSPGAAGPVRVVVDTGADRLRWSGNPATAPSTVTVGTGPGALELDDEGRIEVLVGWGDGASRGERPPQVRASFFYRVVDGRVEVLSLPRLEQLAALGQAAFEWRHAVTVPGLEVRVSAGA